MPRHTIRPVARAHIVKLAMITGAIALTLAGCGSSTTDSSSQGTLDPHNDADISFVADMIPHHEQAVEMADLAATRAESAEVKQLAEQIAGAQGPEIETMTPWLTAWGGPDAVPTSDAADDMGGMEGMDHSGGTMMSDADMSALAAASGIEFDRMWVAMMTSHHEGAIAMGQAEVANGAYPPAIELAASIVTGQSAELKIMDGLMATLPSS